MIHCELEDVWMKGEMSTMLAEYFGIANAMLQYGFDIEDLQMALILSTMDEKELDKVFRGTVGEVVQKAVTDAAIEKAVREALDKE